jgi:flagellar hook-associated protein 3 FlgL
MAMRSLFSVRRLKKETTTMSIGRVSSQFASNQAVSLLQGNQQRLATIQERVASGKNIIRPSDDPLGTTQLLGINVAIRDDDQFIRNIQDALSEIDSSTGALNNVTDLINRASELATQASTITSGSTNLSAIENELNLILDQVVQVGNTSLGGRYVFGGLQTQSAPFTRTGDSVVYSGSASSGSNARQIEVSSGSLVTINVPGDSIFGDVTSTGAPELVSGGSGLIRTLAELKQNVRDGDKDGVRARLDELKTSLSTVLNAQAKLGSVNNRLELTQNRLEGRKSVLSQQYARIQDIDLPKMLSDLNYQQQVTQASLGVTGKVLTQSLLNFI